MSYQTATILANVVKDVIDSQPESSEDTTFGQTFLEDYAADEGHIQVDIDVLIANVQHFCDCTNFTDGQFLAYYRAYHFEDALN